MACVTQSVVGTFQTDLVVGRDGEPYRDVERVCIVLTVGDTGDLAVTLLVHTDEVAGQPFRRCTQQGIIGFWKCLLEL